MGLFSRNKKVKFKGNVNIDGQDLPASGVATSNDNGTYDLIGTAGTPIERKPPEQENDPRHGGCDEHSLRNMEKRIKTLI